MLTQVADGVWVRQSEWVWTNSIVLRGDDERWPRFTVEVPPEVAVLPKATPDYAVSRTSSQSPKSRATIRSSWTPAASGEVSQMIGGSHARCPNPQETTGMSANRGVPSSIVIAR
jgi:hypothetical protein